MQRKKRSNNYLEPMPKKQYQKLIKEFKAIGGIIVSGKEAEKYLIMKGAEASTLNGYTIIFPKRPNRLNDPPKMVHRSTVCGKL